MTFKVIAALLAVDIFWGATFLGMRVAVTSFPPMVLIFFRFISVGILMLGIAYFQGHWRVKRKEWMGLVLTGVGLFTCGNGTFAIALQHIPSSITTLISATGAVWLVLLDWYFTQKRPRTILLVGLVVSLLGVFVLVGKPETGGIDLFWLGVCLLGTIFWTVSAYTMRLVSLPDSTWVAVGWQNIFGALGGAVIALILGEWTTFSLFEVTSFAWAGLSYLILIGSLIGFTCFQWLMTHASPTLVATTPLVNPIVAMILGYLILDEPLGLRIFFSFFIVLVGVIAIILGRNQKTKIEEVI